MMQIATLKRVVLGAALALTLVAALHGAGAAHAAPQRRLGGLNLDAYCQAHGSDGSAVRNGHWICYTPNVTINMDDACEWTYGRGAYAEVEPNNPLAFNCYGFRHLLLGGLNLDAYCQAHGSDGSAVRNGRWICYTPTVVIDLNDACRWSYGAEAHAQSEPGKPLAVDCYLH